jgi:tRNA pseudouridine55 synthase
MTPGIYLVHKAVGETSFSLVQDFMEEVRLAGLRRDKLPVCHGGALDPFAEGLVLLLAGQAARLMDLIHPIPKAYVAEIAWGAESDSGDLLGQMTKSLKSLSPADAPILESLLPGFLGWRDQVPPATSNKRVGGERAYLKAHRGEEVALPPSRVYLHSARWLSHDLPRSSVLELVSGGGYYVRALARDLGRAAGVFGHLTKLRRTAIGPWRDPASGRPQVQGTALYPWCASVEITRAELDRLRADKELEPRPLRPPDWNLPEGFPDPKAPIRALLDGRLAALLRERDGKLAGAPVLRGPM